jgi:hypothetical protein
LDSLPTIGVEAGADLDGLDGPLPGLRHRDRAGGLADQQHDEEPGPARAIAERTSVS